MSLHPELPPLRPWLFRVAHNAALDHLKGHGRRLTDPHADMAELAGVDERPDPYAVRVALAQFLVLPVIQRSAVILKDVLGHSLDETAQIMDTSVMAVKAALVRGRAQLKADAPGKANDRPTSATSTTSRPRPTSFRCDQGSRHGPRQAPLASGSGSPSPELPVLVASS